MKLLRQIVLVLAVFVLGIVILAVASTLAQALTTRSDVPGAMSPLVPRFTHLFMLLLSLLAMLALGRGRLSAFGINGRALIPPVSVVALSLGVGLAANALLAMLGYEFNPVHSYGVVGVIVWVWIWASLCEETLCRGLLQTLFARVFAKAPADGEGGYVLPIVLGAIFFALMHVPLLLLGAPPGALVIILLAAFALGCLAGYVRAVSGSLVPAVIVHALFNMTGSLTDWIVP